MEAFTNYWEKIYNRHREQPPDFEDFWQTFGEDDPVEHTGDLRPTADDLHRYAKRARESSTPGLDGWNQQSSKDCLELPGLRERKCSTYP